MSPLRFCLTLCCALLQVGCTPILAIELFNYTGQSIAVLEKEQSIVIPAGDHKQISYFGSQRAGTDLIGPAVRAGNKQWFYPVSTRKRGLLTIPPGYWQKFGIKRGVNVALDEQGYFYLLSSAEQNLAAIRASQPTGFPLKPK